MDPRELSLLSHFTACKNNEETNEQISQLSQIIATTNPQVATLLPQPKPTQQQLRDRVFTNLRTEWTMLKIPTHTASDYALAHKTYSDEQAALETARIRRVMQVVNQARIAQQNPNLIAEDLGYSSHRQPFVPARHYTVKGSQGALFGILPDTGRPSEYPLLYNEKVTLESISDSFIYLPSCPYLDLTRTISALFTKGTTLGYSRDNYGTCFKLVISKFFSDYANIIATTSDPHEVFEGIITIAKSYDVEGKLTDTLKTFKRKSNQSFPEFSTLLFNLVSRIVQLVFLSFTSAQVQAFCEERLIEHIRHFVSADVHTVLDSYIKASTDGKFHSWAGITSEVYKIETFLKVRISERPLPDTLYKCITTDRTRDSTMMFQAMSLMHPRPHSTSRPSSPQPDKSRARSPSPGLRPPGNTTQRHPASHTTPFSRPPQGSNQYRTGQQSRSPAGPNSSQRGRSPARPDSIQRGYSPARPNPRQRNQSPGTRPNSSPAGPRTGNPVNTRPNSPTSQGHISRPRSRPTSPHSQPTHQRPRSRSQSNPTSPSRYQNRVCPFCHGNSCAVANCSTYKREDLAPYPCRLCAGLHWTRACKSN